MPYSASDVRSRDRILRALLCGPAKAGKAQPLDEPVLTPTGWREIGQLEVGDLVIGSDGLGHAVTGVFPQGSQDIVQIHMNDGAWTRCTWDHLWFTTDLHELNRGRFYAPRVKVGPRKKIPTGVWGGGSIKTTEEIAGSLDVAHYLPRVSEVQFATPSSSLPMDPYYLGLLLGDGSMTNSSVTFTSMDEELFSYVESAAISLGDRVRRYTTVNRCPGIAVVGNAPRGSGRGAGFRPASATMILLRQLDVAGKRSEKKTVPEQYLRASREDRLALLQGLLDTDGHSDKWRAEYCSTSPWLRDAVIDLVRSLGGRAKWKAKATDCLVAYVVGITFPSSDICPFKLKRKVDLWVPSRKRQFRPFIDRVDPAGMAECVCISVDAPDQLYVTRGHILTHNTTSAVLTSPKPVYVMNTDGKGALDPVAAMGGEFLADDIKSSADVTAAIGYVKRNQKSISTVVFDNLTIYWAIVENEVRAEVRDDPRVIYPEAGRRFMKTFHELTNLPCNVILIGHLEPGENNTPGGFGHVLGISGKSKTQISALIQDWIWTEVSPDTNGRMKWEFLLAPQGNWNKGVRSIQGVRRMPANITKFIELAEAQSKKTVQRAPEPKIVTIDEDEDDAVESEEPAASPPVVAKPQPVNGATKPATYKPKMPVSQVRR